MSLLPFLLMAAQTRLPSVILRPSSDSVLTNIASGSWQDIEELDFDDGDYIATNALSTSGTADIKVNLSNPAWTPPTGIMKIRFRARSSSSLGGVQFSPYLFRGTDFFNIPGGSGQAFVPAGNAFEIFECTYDIGGWSDFNNLALAFFVERSSGSGSRSGHLSWAQVVAGV